MILLSTFRYWVVSAICWLLNVILIPLINACGLHYTLAILAAFCLVAIVGFSLHCCWTFNVKPTFESFLRYVSAMILNLPLTIILIGIGHNFVGLSVAISTVMVSILLILWNFIAVRWAILPRITQERHLLE